jgi:hypothetical protein
MMNKKTRTDPGNQHQNAARTLGPAFLVPLFLVMTGAGILAYGWLQHAQTPQTLGAVVAGIGCVALLSRFLRGQANR